MKIIITIKAVVTAAAVVVMVIVVVVVVDCNGLIYINNLPLLISYYKSNPYKCLKNRKNNQPTQSCFKNGLAPMHYEILQNQTSKSKIHS